MKLTQVIDRYIGDMNGTPTSAPLKPLGESHLYTLLRLKKDAIADKDAATLKKHDIIDFCKRRILTVCPATVNQDICYLAGILKYAPSAWEDCDGISDASIAAARPFLLKHNLIGKSAPRTRTPTADEIDRLMAHLTAEDKRSTIQMAQLFAFALVSTRRISEICRMQHGDIQWDNVDEAGDPAPMYMVRDLKHPTKKKGNNKTFPLLPELAEIIRRQPRLTTEPTERVFPFRSKSASQRYTRAKHLLGIKGLRFHDNRREAITRWLKVLPPHQVKSISGHETTHILERVYDASKPERLHAEVARVLRERERPAA